MKPASMAMRKRHNFLIGFVLISAVSMIAAGTIFGDVGNFSPPNAWLWLALLALLACGFGASTIGLVRKVHWGYCAWSQIILSYLVLAVYIGWIRRESDYRHSPDPEESAPIATFAGLLRVVVIWLAVALLPFGARTAARWIRARRRQEE